MSTASQLRDALLALATPTPKELPPALAGVFPAGCFLRARTAAEELEFMRKVEENNTTYADDYTRNHASIMLAISYSVCDEKGELLYPGNPDAFNKIPAWARFPIADEIRVLMKNEVPEQGKDLPAANSPSS